MNCCMTGIFLPFSFSKTLNVNCTMCVHLFLIAILQIRLFPQYAHDAEELSFTDVKVEPY